MVSSWLSDAASAATVTRPDFKSTRKQLLTYLKQGEIGSAVDSIGQLLQYDKEHSEALAEFVVKYLLPHDDMELHESAFSFLTQLKEAPGQNHVIEQASKHKHWETRAACVRIMATYGGAFVHTKLEEALEDKKWQVRAAAIRAMGTYRSRANIPVLIAHLEKARGRLRQDLVWSLEQLTAKRFPAVHADWRNWWAVHESDFEMPSMEEIRKSFGKSEKKSLKTAVADGLYGRVYSEKIAFLFDVSGSMSVGTDLQGTRAQIALKELMRVLENDLTPKTSFNIIAFSEEIFPFKRKLIRNNTSNVKRAKRFVEDLPVGGETNVYGALKQAFADPDIDTIVLLSDGSPTVGEQTIANLIRRDVRNWNRDRKIIINCIGFFPGDSRSEDKEEAREFLRNLCHENEGFFHDIF